MRTAIIVQARMTSTRLPGKVLLPVLGKPLLLYLIERLRRVREADQIIIATTVNETDQPIVDFCKREGVACFRGPEEDVLARYYGAALEDRAEVVVRVTSDCPLIDPEVIDQVIRKFKDGAGALDYVSNTQTRAYPRGMDTEVFSFKALKEAFQEAVLPAEREHVTSFLYRRPERFRLGQVIAQEDNSRYRWTVDTREDYELVTRLIEACAPVRERFTLADLLAAMRAHPDWYELNRHIEQKKA